MFFQTIILAALALVASFALALPTDKQAIQLHTDDPERLSKVNIPAITQLLEASNTHNYSYDGTGLKLGGIHFHYKPHHMVQHGSDNRTTFNNMAAPPHPTPVIGQCGITQCSYWTDVKWIHTNQALLVRPLICQFLGASVSLPPAGDAFAIWFENARCLNDDPCTLVGGAMIYEQPSGDRENKALLMQCSSSIRLIADDRHEGGCGHSGGMQACHVSEGSGRLVYFAQPDDIGFGCGNTWYGQTACFQVTCHSANGYCDGNHPLPAILGPMKQSEE